jgi:hypothetical protein
LEGFVFGGIEEYGQNNIGELILLMNLEGPATGQPGDDASMGACFFDLLQQKVELPGEMPCTSYSSLLVSWTIHGGLSVCGMLHSHLVSFALPLPEYLPVEL